MKYEAEIETLLNEIFPEQSWMTEEENKELIAETLKQLGITKQKLSDEIETGIKNGSTVEQQIQIVKTILGR